MKRFRFVFTTVVLTVVSGCSTSNSNAQGQDVGDESVKRQVVAYVAAQENMNSDDVTSFHASVEKAVTDGVKTFQVVGDFTVETDQPTNVNEVAKQIAAQASLTPKNNSGQFHHQVYFDAIATPYQKLDGSAGLKISFNASVDKTLADVAKEQQAKREAFTPLNIPGNFEIRNLGRSADGEVIIAIKNNTDYRFEQFGLLVGYTSDGLFNDSIQIDHLDPKSTKVVRVVSESTDLRHWHFNVDSGQSIGVGPNAPTGHRIYADTAWETLTELRPGDLDKIFVHGSGLTSGIQVQALTSDELNVNPPLHSDEVASFDSQAQVISTGSFEVKPTHMGLQRPYASLLLTVNADGSVSDAILEEGSGDRFVDKKLPEYINSWRFKPTMQKGKPVQWVYRVIVPLSVHHN